MAEESGGEKTLAATPQKKQKAREEGNIAKSQDLNSAVALGMALVAMLFFAPFILRTLLVSMRFYLGQSYALLVEDVSLSYLFETAMIQLAWCVVPFMVVMMFSGALVSLAQVGFLLTTKPLQPKLSRLDPVSGMKKFVSLRSLVELGKSLTKLGVVGFVVWSYLSNNLESFLALMLLDPVGLLVPVSGIVVGVWWRVVAAMLVLGIVDYGYQIWQREQELKMTQQEMRQETKEMEGDPHIKRRVRQLQRQMATQRMMAEVPEADVIITNPTRYAVALRYDVTRMSSPIVVAKGERLVAQKIRDLATEHGVPIVRNPPLARTLFRTVALEESIPETLFRTVAEVLTFVYEIDKRVEKRRERALLTQGAVRAAS